MRQKNTPYKQALIGETRPSRVNEKVVGDLGGSVRIPSQLNSEEERDLFIRWSDECQKRQIDIRGCEDHLAHYVKLELNTRIMESEKGIIPAVYYSQLSKFADEFFMHPKSQIMRKRQDPKKENRFKSNGKKPG